MNTWQWMAGIAFIFITALCGCRTSERVAPEPTNVVVQRANVASEAHDLAYSGTMEESETIPLSFASMGTVAQVYVSEGASVKKGQILARLDNTIARNGLARSRASERQAKDAYRRLEPMHTNGNLPDIKFVEAETGLQQATASAANSQKALDDCDLRAPVDGYVGKRSVDPGMVALPNIASITLVKMAKVYASISVPEDEISSVKQGERATVRIRAIGPGEYQGTVEEIGVMADPVVHSYKIRIAVDNKDGRIKPGMVCTAVLRHPAAVRGLLVPHQAIMIDEASRQFVYVVDTVQHKALRTPISTGNYLHDGIEVPVGLTAGDLVVVEGQHKLVDQASVTIINRY